VRSGTAPLSAKEADGDGVNGPEATTEGVAMVRLRRVCRGPQGAACMERVVENLGDPGSSCAVGVEHR
jgi:hypothetical protein